MIDSPKSNLGNMKQSFEINNNDIEVRWESVDPISAHWPEQYHDVGVLFVPSTYDDESQIKITNHISKALQAYSALHEKLCMIEKIDECSSIESLVIDSIDSNEEKITYIDLRIKMFGILVNDNPNQGSFNKSFDFLKTFIAKEN